MASVEVVRPLEESVPDEGGGGPCQVGDVDGQGYGQDGSHDGEGGDSQDREDEDEVHGQEWSWPMWSSEREPSGSWTAIKPWPV